MHRGWVCSREGLDCWVDGLIDSIIRDKKLPLAASGIHALRAEHTRTIEPALALAAETLNLERTLSDLVNQAAYSLTPVEIELTWKTAPPRMPSHRPQLDYAH